MNPTSHASQGAGQAVPPLPQESRVSGAQGDGRLRNRCKVFHLLGHSEVRSGCNKLGFGST